MSTVKDERFRPTVASWKRFPLRSPSLMYKGQKKKGRDEHSWAKYHGVLVLLFCCALRALRVGSQTKRKRQSISLRRFLIGRRFPFFLS